MQMLRPAALAMLVLAMTGAGAGAQTCQGLSSFQDGKARIGAEYRHADTYDAYREGLTYGAHDSWFASVGAEQMQLAHAAGWSEGGGVSVGYQVHVQTTPFQVCPVVTVDRTSDGGATSTTLGLGGALGYRLFIADNFNLVPAAGIRWLSASTSGGGGSVSSSEVFMALGFVLRRTLTLYPTVRIPSTSGAKDILGIGVTWNWAK